MAAYAPLRPAVWSDADFRALTPEARLLYLYLVSHPKLSRCGVAPFVPDRWAAQLGYPIDGPLASLEADRYVIVDRETFEVLVRTKVKHDPPTSWQQVSAVWKAWALIESPVLAGAVAVEMPDAGWETPRSPAPIPRPDTPSDRASDTPSNPPKPPETDTPSDTPCDTPSDRACHTPLRVTPTPAPSPSPTPNQSRSAVLTDDEEDPRIGEALALVAHRRAPGKSPSYLARIVENLRAEANADVDAARLCAEYPDAPASLIAASLAGDDSRNLAMYRKTDTSAPPADPASNVTAVAKIRTRLQDIA